MASHPAPPKRQTAVAWRRMSSTLGPPTSSADEAWIEANSTSKLSIRLSNDRSVDSGYIAKSLSHSTVARLFQNEKLPTRSRGRFSHPFESQYTSSYGKSRLRVF